MDSSVDTAVRAFQSGDLAGARDLALRHLQVEPKSPLLMHLLGLIECRSGNIEAGVEWLRSASDAEPHNAAFRTMLVRALIDSGHAPDGLTAAGRPAGATPPELALWHARAEAALAAEDWIAAADSWATLCSAHPGDWRAWSNYGESLAKLARWEEAAEALRTASRLNPAEAPIRLNLASALAHAGEHEACASVLDEIVRIWPSDVAARLTLARLLGDLGRNEHSLRQLQEAARRTVGDPRAANGDDGLIRIAVDERPSEGPLDRDIAAVRELALLLERTNRTNALGKLLADAESIGIARERLAYPAAVMALREGDPAAARRLLEIEPVDSDPVRWHRLMARIAESLGDTQAAFSEAETMHSAMPGFTQWRERGRIYREELRQLERLVAGSGVGLGARDLGDRRSPAFLVGFPRSGTTLADTFLMGHPDIRIVEEEPTLAAAESVLGGILRLADAAPDQLLNARGAYFSALDGHVERGFAGLVIDKLPLNMTRLPLIHALFPDARIIFVQRHPCDCVLSAFMQSFVLNPAMACFLDIGDAADLYDAAISLFVQSRAKVPAQVHTLVYEALVEDPEAALRPTLDFLGLGWRAELLDHRATARSRGAIGTPSYDQVSEPLRDRSVGRWRTYEQQLAPVLPLLLPWAERLGYRAD